MAIKCMYEKSQMQRYSILVNTRKDKNAGHRQQNLKYRSPLYVISVQLSGPATI